MLRISSFAQKYFFVLVSLAALIGASRCGCLVVLLPQIKLLLGLVMFAMGLVLHFEDFRETFARPKALLAGIASQYLIMPALAYVLALILRLPPELALGLVLVGSAPGGTVSNVMVYICKADLPLSITMTFFSTLIAPLVLPLLMWIYASRWVTISALDLFVSTIQLVFLPLVLGLILSKIFARNLWIKKRKLDIDACVSLIAIVLVCLIIAIMVAVNIEEVYQVKDLGLMLYLVILAVFLHNACGFFLGYYLPRFIFRQTSFSTEQLRSIAIEVGIQNSGLASVLALGLFGPLAVVPAVFSAIWHSVAGSALANYWRTRTAS